MTNKAYLWKAMLGGALGTALFCAAYLAIPDLNVISNFAATPLYAVPLAFALFRLGRVGSIGALMLIGGVTIAHLEGTAAALATHKIGPTRVCLFGDVAKCNADYEREHAAHEPIGRVTALNAGAQGGALGAAFSFAFIATLAPGLRDRRRLILYAAATAVLTALGAIGFTGTFPEDSEHRSLEWVLKLYLPWQLVFTAAIVTAFKDHRAERFSLFSRATAP